MVIYGGNHVAQLVKERSCIQVVPGLIPAGTAAQDCLGERTLVDLAW